MGWGIATREAMVAVGYERRGRFWYRIEVRDALRLRRRLYVWRCLGSTMQSAILRVKYAFLGLFDVRHNCPLRQSSAR